MLKRIAVEYKRLPVYDLVRLCNSKPEILKIVTEKDFIYNYPILTFQFDSGNKYFFFNNHIYRESSDSVERIRTVAINEPLREIREEFNDKLQKSELDLQYSDGKLMISSTDKYTVYKYTDYQDSSLRAYARELEFLYYLLTMSNHSSPFTNIQHMQYYFRENISDEDLYLLSPFVSNSVLLTNPLFLTNSEIPLGEAKEYWNHSASFLFKPQTGVLYLNQLKNTSVVKYFVPVGDINRTALMQPQVRYIQVNTDPKPIKDFFRFKNNLNNLNQQLRDNILNSKFIIEDDPNYMVGTVDQLISSYILKAMQYISNLDAGKVTEVQNSLYPIFSRDMWLQDLRQTHPFFVLTEIYNKLLSISSKVDVPYSFIKSHLPTEEEICSRQRLSSILDVLITFNKCIDSLEYKEIEALVSDLNLIFSEGKHANKIPKTKHVCKEDSYIYKCNELSYKALYKVIQESGNKIPILSTKSLRELPDVELEQIMDELKVHDRLSVNVAKYLLNKEVGVYKLADYYTTELVDTVTRCVIGTSDMYIDENNYLTFSNIKINPTEDYRIVQVAAKEAYIGVGKYLVEKENLAGVLQRNDNSDINICTMAVPEIIQTIEDDGVEYLVSANIDIDDANLANYHQSIKYFN